MARILIVDDDPLALEIVRSILQSKGETSDSASDGFAAIRMVHENHYDLVLVDYHLPEMDGYALAKLMRDIGTWRGTRTRLVGVTADRHGLATRRGVDGIFDKIVAKPLRPAELLELVGDIPLPDAIDGEIEAASSFLANPNFQRARAAATSFWRARGLRGIPKIAVFPSPELNHAEEIRACFDIVEEDSAELLLLLDVRGLQELLLARVNGRPHILPVITFDRSLSAVCDACFDVADRTSWSGVADLITGRSALKS